MTNELVKWRAYVDFFFKGYCYGRKLISSTSCDLNEEESELLSKVNRNHYNALNSEQHKLSATGKSDISVIICSPHPDDECLTGALPLRLLQENKACVLNLAITLGSDQTRRQERFQELKQACEAVGFKNKLIKTPEAFNNFSKDERASNSKQWQRKVEIAVAHFHENRPDYVIFPHEKDGHPTHVIVHFLISDALELYSKQAKCQVIGVENEFWHPMVSPKLLVGVKSNDLALLVAGVSKHHGEIIRNPYHLSMPARMMDNVRRGGELILGRRSSIPKFCFGEMYGLSIYSEGEKREWSSEKMIFSPEDLIEIKV